MIYYGVAMLRQVQIQHPEMGQMTICKGQIWKHRFTYTQYHIDEILSSISVQLSAVDDAGLKYKWAIKKFAETNDDKKPIWGLVKGWHQIMCPRCENSPLLSDDYLCEKCRFGI